MLKAKQLMISEDTWEQFKATLTRDKTINEHLVHMIEEHIRAFNEQKGGDNDEDITTS